MLLTDAVECSPVGKERCGAVVLKFNVTTGSGFSVVKRIEWGCQKEKENKTMMGRGGSAGRVSGFQE